MGFKQSGHLLKMEANISPEGYVEYQLPLDEYRVPLNQLIGRSVRIEYLGDIHCIHCGRRSKKSFSQGYCYPCFTKLPQCDTCIMSPERCHYHAGTCRDPQWGEKYCFTDHFVYLSNTSGVKVGITRGTQLPTRWIDQGATQALPIMRVRTRLQSGAVEVAFKQHVADKTNWRDMLKGTADSLDMPAERDRLVAECRSEIDAMTENFGDFALSAINGVDTVEIRYPVVQYPEKIVSQNFDKNPCVKGTLLGIKGQYLLFDIGVINLRKFSGYEVAMSY